jgi:hypothetical protein
MSFAMTPPRNRLSLGSPPGLSLSDTKKKVFHSIEEAEQFGMFLHFLLCFTLLLCFALTLGGVISCSSADEVIHIDLDFPERHGGFFVHVVSNVKTTTGSELIDKLKIMLPHVTDIRDFKDIEGHVVLNGRAFLVSMPTLPYFLLDDYEDLWELEKTPCPRTEETHAIAVNQIRKTARQMKSILLR